VASALDFSPPGVMIVSFQICLAEVIRAHPRKWSVRSSRSKMRRIDRPGSRAVRALLGSALLLASPGLAAPLLAAPFASARVHDGGHFVVDDHPDLNPGASGITLLAWVWRENSTGYQTILGKDFRTGYWLGITPEGKIRFYTHGTGSNLDGNGVIPLQRWTQITVTYDGASRRRYYLNGALDFESTGFPGPLGSNATPLILGADVTGYPFTGGLDDIKLWRTALSAGEVAYMVRPTGMWSATWALVSHWDCVPSRADPSVILDPLRGHHATGVAPFEFSPTGAFQSVEIPTTTATITIDGGAGATEYAGAGTVYIDHPFRPVAYLVHDATYLYVFLGSLPRGTNATTFAGVMLDPNHDRADPAHSDDYRFLVTFDGTATAQRGDGAGGYLTMTTAAGDWSAAVSSTEFTWNAEFRIRLALVGLEDPTRGAGIDVGHFWVNFQGDDYHWPALGSWNLPSQWGNGYFSSRTITSRNFSFPGQVVDSQNLPIGDVRLDLFGSLGGLLSPLANVSTGSDGRYLLQYIGAAPDGFVVQEIDAAGTYSIAADAGADGTSHNLNLLQYPAHDANTTYSAGKFTDGRGVPPSEFFDRHLLVVYSAPVREGDLGVFMDWKRRLGWQVEPMTVQSIQASQPGRDLAEKIRNWLKGRWLTHSPHPVYALLVGRGDVLPIRPVAWSFDEVHLPVTSPRYHPAIPSDWYYADLDSDWDPDGDGYFGEGLGCLFQDCWHDPTPIELPRGTSPSADDDWTAEISIGRLGVNEPAEVRAALAAAMAAEMSGSPAKRRGLLAGGFWGFDGRSWDSDPGKYVEPSDAPLSDDAFLDGAIYFDWDGDRPFGLDTAEHLEAGLKLLLAPHFTGFTRLYEGDSPGGNPSLIPTRQPFDLPLTFENLDHAWSTTSYGLVNLEGHGNDQGIWAHHWVNDWNHNGRIDQPANPAETGGSCDGDPPCWELSDWYPVIQGSIGDPAGVPPVVFANACATGAVAWASDGRDDDGNVRNLRYGPEALAGILQGHGKVAAWMGCLTVSVVGGLDGLQDDFSRDIVSVPLTLGDALWKGMGVLARANTQFDWRVLTPQLFGDPTAYYWGNPADPRSPWPQSGRDWWASGSTPQSGPATARIAWVTDESDVLSPPVVELAGSLIVGRTSGYARFSSYGQLHFQGGAGPVSESPVLTTHGFDYATGSTLESFDRYGVEVFGPTLPGAATGAPRVGPDGIVWVPTSAGMVRVLGDGVPQLLEGGAASGPAAFTPAGQTVWSAGRSLYFYQLDRLGVTRVTRIDFSSVGTLTAPAVRRDGLVLLGSSTGRLLAARFPDSRPWEYFTGAAVTVRPTVDSRNHVYLGDGLGRIHCVDQDGNPLWARALPAPVQAPMAVDGSRLYVAAGGRLLALNSGSGEPVWDLDLEGGTGPQSTPVIGFNRTIYLTRADGRLAAVVEGWAHLAPEGVLAEPLAGGRFHLQWTDTSSGETGFAVEACDLAGGCTEVARAGAGQQAIDVAGMAPGTPLVFRVRTVGLTPPGGGGDVPGASDSSDFAYSEVVTTLPDLPIAPVSLFVQTESASALRLSWKFGGDRSQLLGFEIRRKKGTGAPTTEVAGNTGASVSEFLDKNLEPAATYSYSVVALNAAGSSPPSAAASGKTRTIGLAPPTHFLSAVVAGGIDLSWKDANSGESGYVLERNPEGVAGFETVAQLGPDSTSFPDRQGITVSFYTYRLKAVSASSESPYLYASARAGVPGPGAGGAKFIRGDANADGNLDLSDGIAILSFLFTGGAAPVCPDAADVSDQGQINISSAIYLLGYLFTGGAAPPPPRGACGVDPTSDGLPDCNYPAAKCGG
jgi:hypothetical protein